MSLQTQIILGCKEDYHTSCRPIKKILSFKNWSMQHILFPWYWGCVKVVQVQDAHPRAPIVCAAATWRYTHVWQLSYVCSSWGIERKLGKVLPKSLYYASCLTRVEVLRGININFESLTQLGPLHMNLRIILFFKWGFSGSWIYFWGPVSPPLNLSGATGD